LQREPLGGQLADHDRDVRDHDGDGDQRDRGGDGLGEAERLGQHRTEIIGQCRATERGGQEAGQGDADLHGGQEAIRILAQPGHGPAAFTALGQLPDLGVPERDQGHLGRREHASDRDEDEDHDDVEQGVVHGHSCFVLWLSPSSVGPASAPDSGPWSTACSLITPIP
jgi:hypothetical protein